MRKKHITTIKINLSSKELAEAMHRALKPESDTRVKIAVDDSTLTMDFETETLATLRALTNSYLRCIIAAKNAVDAANARFETSQTEFTP